MQEPIINIAIQAARAAGNIITRAARRPDLIKVTEKIRNDYVTDTDQHAEQEIIRTIKKAYPRHGIIGEESGEQEGQEYVWIIDPLDGTRNFIHGVPHFAVSIAIRYQNRIEHSVIFDPVREELFIASRGKGAKLNDHRIRVSSRKQLNECLLGTGFPYRHTPDQEAAYADMLKAILPACGDIRRAGSAALDLAYVAAGRLDGYWEMALKLWDIAAGVLLVREAGGLICDPLGGEDYLHSGDIVAANPAVMRLLLKAIQPHVPKR